MRYNQNRAIPPRMRQLEDGSFYRRIGTPRLNRSRKWMPAQSYQQAREQSPSTRPVR